MRHYPGGRTPDWHRYLFIAVATVVGLSLPWIVRSSV